MSKKDLYKKALIKAFKDSDCNKEHYSCAETWIEYLISEVRRDEETERICNLKLRG